MVLAAVCSGSVKTAAADPTISEKRAQADDVLNQIREIDSQLSHAVEAYNLANLRLERIEADVVANARHLGIARTSPRPNVAAAPSPDLASRRPASSIFTISATAP